jgi:hypothetical protein
MRRILFHFCSPCWSDRRACEEQMNAVTGPVPVKGAA